MFEVEAAVKPKNQIFPERKQAIIAGTLPGQKSTFSDLKSARFDPDSLWERVDEDPELLRDLTAVFAGELPGMLSRIEAAIQNTDTAELEKAAHKIKGSALQFSAPRAAEAAQQLEELGRSGKAAGAEMLLRTLQQEIDLLMALLNSMARRVAR